MTARPRMYAYMKPELNLFCLRTKMTAKLPTMPMAEIDEIKYLYT